MMSHGYNSDWSEGSVKVPLFQTSTFKFKSAQSGEDFFKNAYTGEGNSGLIYSRLNNPNLEILERRISLLDGYDQSAVFCSGMGAISSTLMTFLKPGDAIICSMPVYGGTNHFLDHYLKNLGVEVVFFKPCHSKEDIFNLCKLRGLLDKVKMIYIETPANPTNALISLKLIDELSYELSTTKCLTVVDNTYLGPLFQKPKDFNIDLVIYSATKFLGGHSDLIAGCVSGSNELLSQIKGTRTFFGSTADPHTCWLLLRSLETLKIRMEEQARSAKKVAEFLKNHDKIEKVYFLDYLDGKQKEIFDQQCLSAGSMISFDIKSTKEDSFKFLDKLELITLAVSLGSTESLIQHPWSMTHYSMDERTKTILGINPNMVRLSVGLEDPEDLIKDIEKSLI